MDRRPVGSGVDECADGLGRRHRATPGDQGLCGDTTDPEPQVHHGPVGSDRDANHRHQSRTFGMLWMGSEAATCFTKSGTTPNREYPPQGLHRGSRRSRRCPHPGSGRGPPRAPGAIRPGGRRKRPARAAGRPPEAGGCAGPGLLGHDGASHRECRSPGYSRSCGLYRGSGRRTGKREGLKNKSARTTPARTGFVLDPCPSASIPGSSPRPAGPAPGRPTRAGCRSSSSRPAARRRRPDRRRLPTGRPSGHPSDPCSVLGRLVFGLRYDCTARSTASAVRRQVNALAVAIPASLRGSEPSCFSRCTSRR